MMKFDIESAFEVGSHVMSFNGERYGVVVKVKILRKGRREYFVMYLIEEDDGTRTWWDEDDVSLFDMKPPAEEA